MITEKLEDLRQIVADKQTDTETRQAAAVRFITELVDTVPAPADDDAEVQARMRPWADRTLSAIVGPAADGESLPVARKEVWTRHKLRAVLARVCDTAAHQLERLAACAWVLENYGFIKKWGTNNYTAERLLAEMLPAHATKLASAFDPPVTVARPPVELKDVWRL